MKKNLFQTAVVLLLGASLTSCQDDAYNKGEGDYSLMRAELADIQVDGQKQAIAFQTDDNQRYNLDTWFTAAWITRPDTVYRAAVYFTPKGDRASIVTVGSIPMLRPVPHWKMKSVKTDPVGFESAWIGRNRRYLNLSLLLKSGVTDDAQAKHSIGLAQDTILVGNDGRRTAYYRFVHDQGAMPQYYSNRHYMSILLPDDEQRPDTVCLRVMTYQGMIEKKYEVGQ